MRVMQFADYGPPEVLQPAEVEMPQPGAGQILVKIAAAAVNPADYKWREGMFRAHIPLPLPHVVGYDAAGTVEALGGGVDRFAPGDRVIVHLDAIEKGGYAEYAVRDAAVCAKVPDGLDMAIAAALPTGGLTGVQQIEEHVRPEPGQTVLITGATGAVGRFALHAALAMGVKVVAAVRRSQFAEAERLGATQVIELGGNIPDDLAFDHVADTVGGPEVAALCRRMRPGGRIITVSTTPIDPAGLPATPQFIGLHPDAERLARLAADVASGTLEVPIARRMPLEQAAEAQRLVEAGGLGGKIVLIP
ncbi:MAG: NADP-dependent oxidoreductase [Sphingomonadaceae bacterium]|nr:NADP-dependent oxidoreductase [Sphingomonadaceae bacterium]